MKGDFAWISKGSLAKGHKIEFELFSQLIDVGSIPNTIQNVRIYDEKGNVVTRNYRIAEKGGHADRGKARVKAEKGKIR